MKMNRLLNRINKVLTELTKSDLSLEQKGFVYRCFWGYVSGFCEDLEKEYPKLTPYRENL